MRTYYSNSKHPKFARYSAWVTGISGGICLAIYWYLGKGGWRDLLLYTGSLSLLYSTIFMSLFYVFSICIDEHAGTISESRHWKYSLLISKLTTITYKESKKGHFRSLYLQDKSSNSMNIRITKQNADLIVAQLTRINPAIKVVHGLNP